MKNRIEKLSKNIFCLLLAIIFISSCSKHKAEDPLIIPPNFNEMPDLNNPQPDKKQTSNPDIEELRELLLKN
jgi:hypothetical protein